MPKRVKSQDETDAERNIPSSVPLVRQLLGEIRFLLRQVEGTEAEPVTTRPKRRTTPTPTDTPSRNRKVYRVLPLKQGQKWSSRLATLIPIERTAMDYLLLHDGASAAQIATETGMNGKSVESALWRLRKVHRFIRSVKA